MRFLFFFSIPTLPSVNKIISTAPDLQPKQPVVDDLLGLEDPDQVPIEGEEQEVPTGEGDGDAGDSESDEDDVQITIGDITTVPSGYSHTPSYTRMAVGTTGKRFWCDNHDALRIDPHFAAGPVQSSVKKVDVEAIPQVGGQSLLDFDLEAADKPWRLPGLKFHSKKPFEFPFCFQAQI